MDKFFKRNSRHATDVAISEKNGVRSLHLGGTMIQSAMRIIAPNELELLYTRCMMSFLLFHPLPSRILMLGLGGGSLAKFVYRKMLQTKTTVVEINPQVISTAFNYFALPAEDERFRIILADGAQYVADHPRSTDVLMIDGFNDDCQIDSLCSQEFYHQAHQALGEDGVLVVNLLSRDKNLNTYVQRINDSFQGCIFTMLTEVRGNLIVFALKQNCEKLSWNALKARAEKLKEIYGLPFPDFVSKLREFTDNHNDDLEI
jgi:spermidine synthase